MKAEVFDILMYLFETYLDDVQSDIPSEESIRNELAKIGFQDAKVNKAFDWLDDLSFLTDDFAYKDALHKSWRNPSVNHSPRIFNQLETNKFAQQAQGLLIELVELGIISAGQRELIIDKALALDIAHINQEQMKWVILMVLFNQPDSAAAFTWIQDLLYKQTPTIH